MPVIGFPSSFAGWSYTCNNPQSKLHGTLCVVWRRNAIAPEYWDAIGLDGSSPAIADSKLRELLLDGKLTPPACN